MKGKEAYSVVERLIRTLGSGPEVLGCVLRSLQVTTTGARISAMRETMSFPSGRSKKGQGRTMHIPDPRRRRTRH